MASTKPLLSLPMDSRPPLNLARFFSPQELILLVIAFILTSFSAWWVNHLGLTLALTDAAAHLNFSRLVSNSLTPGISQIGFWPPLLQILMAPFAAITPLYRNGLAGYIVLVPFMMAATIFIYRIVLGMTRSIALAVAAPLIFLLNPYVLYYASVPMMEMLFTANVLGVAYFLYTWLQTRQLKLLIWLGVFVTLASLSRYEGLLLVPIVGGTLLLDMYIHKREKVQVEATMLLFAMLVMVSVIFILLYSWVFGGSPLAFMNSNVIRDPAANLSITQFSIGKTFEYFAAASGILIGSALSLVALLLGAVSAVRHPKRFMNVAVLLVLISPAIAILAAMFIGHESVLTPGLPPYMFFHNDRYALTWIPFVAVAPALGYSLLTRSLSERLRPLLFAFCTVLIGYSLYHLVDVAFIQKYPAIAENINGPIDLQRSDQLSAAGALGKRYDFGYVLITRSNEDPLIHQAGVPLKNYIYEANYRYFEQAEKEPEIFARFIVVHNPNDVSDTWSLTHDTLDSAVLKSPNFAKYYTLVYQNNSRRIYQVNQSAVIQLATERGYNPQLVPSLVKTKVWDPSTVYASLTTTTEGTDLVSNKVGLASAVQSTYHTDLQHRFANGYQVDSSGNGVSDNQAYIMRMALDARDQQTFDTAWKWTQSNLERPDHLISSRFLVSTGGVVTIQDQNSSTSSDLDIARSLLKAGRAFNISTYGDQGARLANAIWDHDTEYDGQGRRHVLAGNWGRLTQGFVMSAQSLDVDALQSFILVDPSHDWTGLKAQSLADLQTIGQTAFSGRSGGLPTNWALLQPVKGTFSHYDLQAGSNDYSYGAFRAIYFAAHDAKNSQDPATIAYLKTVTAFSEQPVSGAFCSVYIDGKECYNDPASLSAPLGQLSLVDLPKAQDLIGKTLLLHGSVQIPKTDFFQAAWYWFALNEWSQR